MESGGGVQVHQDVVGAVFFKLVDIGLDALGQLLAVGLVDGGIVHVPAGQVLGQDVEKDVVLILHDGLVDAALDEGAGGDGLAPIGLGQDGHALLPGLFKQQALYLVIVPEAVLSSGGVEDPVADVDHVQQTPKFLFAQFQLHTCDLLAVGLGCGVRTLS